MHRVARKEYADKVSRYRLQTEAFTYVYVYAYIYVRVHIHAHITCAPYCNHKALQTLYLMSVGFVVTIRCLVGVRERTVQFGGKELFGGYNCW